MQALILLFTILGLCSAGHLTLLPYAYLADPDPVYHQFQNTRTGEHAYSYAGGPSAKEEVKGIDGVTRGSYSYIDANGALQSVFYVADEGGFRVAATNLPSENEFSLQPAELFLAKPSAGEASSATSSRKKRSLEDTDQNSNQAPQGSKDAIPEKNQQDQTAEGSAHSFVYASPDAVFIPNLIATASSHQSQVQIHRNVKLESEEPAKVAEKPVAVEAAGLPTATSHQSQVQVHKNFQIELPESEGATKASQPVVHAPLASIVPVGPITAYSIENLPVAATLPSYHENRIQFHRDLGIEGPQPKDAVKIKSASFALLDAPAPLVPVVPSVLTKAAPIKPATASFTTTISSHGVSQIHGDSKVAVASPIFPQPTVLLKTAVVPEFQPIVGLRYFHALPYAHAAHYRTQIHSDRRLE